MRLIHIRSVFITLTVAITSIVSVLPAPASQIEEIGLKTPGESFRVGLELFSQGATNHDLEKMAESFPWLSNAYEQSYFDDNRLFSFLGLLYRNGMGTAANNDKAAEVFSKGVMRADVETSVFLICLTPYQSTDETDEALRYARALLEKNPYLDENFFTRWIGIFDGGLVGQPQNHSCALELARISHAKGHLSGTLFYSAVSLDDYVLAVQSGQSYAINVIEHIDNLENVYLNGTDDLRAPAALQLSLANYLGLVTGEPNTSLGRKWLDLAANAGSLDAKGMQQALSDDRLKEDQLQCEYSCDMVKGFRELHKQIVHYVAEYEEAKAIEAEYQSQAEAQRQFYLQQNQQRIQASRQKRKSFWRSVGKVLAIAAGVYVGAKYSQPSAVRTYNQPYSAPARSRSPSTQRQKVYSGSCRTKVDCYPGQFCLKAQSTDMRGVCGVSVDSSGIRTFDEYGTYPSTMAQQCQFKADCPAGFSCRKTGLIHGVCVK